MHITEAGYQRSEELGKIERAAFERLNKCRHTFEEAEAYVAWREARATEKDFNDSLGIVEDEV